MFSSMEPGIVRHFSYFLASKVVCSNIKNARSVEVLEIVTVLSDIVLSDIVFLGIVLQGMLE